MGPDFSSSTRVAHINNLYNTTFWALVHGGQSERQAHESLQGTVSADKHEILFSRFGINYDKLPAMFRRGTTLVWGTTTCKEGGEKDQDTRRQKAKQMLRTLHVDIIGKGFWTPGNDERANGSSDESVSATCLAWEAAERVTNYKGLGHDALLA